MTDDDLDRRLARERQRRSRENRKQGRVALRGVYVDLDELRGFFHARGLARPDENLTPGQLARLVSLLISQLIMSQCDVDGDDFSNQGCADGEDDEDEQHE
jgi:hypothetical protein